MKFGAMNIGLRFALAAILLTSFELHAQTRFDREEKAKGILQIGRMSHAALRESSGVIPASNTNLFWTHNDGSSGLLFLIRSTGETVAQHKITGAGIRDWEDIARDDQGNLYVADIGNNLALRQELRLHRIPEPALDSNGGSVAITQSWRLRFPAKAFDCESFFVWKDDGFVVSKVFNDQRAAIYSFPLNATNAPVTLRLVAELPVTSPVTGADVSPDGAELGLVTRSGAYLFRVDGDLSRAAHARPRFAGFRAGQIEGCCFVSEGLLAVSEEREVFLYTPAAFKDK